MHRSGGIAALDDEHAALQRFTKPIHNPESQTIPATTKEKR